MPPSIPELEARIAEFNQEIAQSRQQARALYELGKNCAQQLGDYFNPQLEAQARRSAAVLANLPLTTAGSWREERWKSWDVATSREAPIIRFGSLVEQRANGNLRLPAYAPFIGQNRTIIITSKGRGVEKGAALLQSLVTRTALMLPHQTRYTLLDPAGNGLAFPMRRYLPLVRENSGDVRRDLDEVTKDVQRIIEAYLDASVTSFELVPDEIRINERFQFVFAADFPNQYDRRAIEALQSVANTGTKAGVYTFIHYNQNIELPRDLSMDGFKNAFYVSADEEDTLTKINLKLQIDSAPPPDLQSQVFQVLSQAKPPERLLDWDSLVGMEENAWWNENGARIIEAPIGARTGNERLRVWFGVNQENKPCAHGMLGAMTGAGKSNLYHVLICGLAVRYSPEELRLYLIDGKDGVEFQPYRHLPHAEVVSLRSSPELSRSVLAELIAEKEYRNAIFARVGVNDFSSYRAKGQPQGNLPRVLLLVDEYQELFEGDKDGIASNHLLQLSQQGRSAGIHMLLASQRFGAAGMLNQTGIFGNIHLLMAMQMKAADISALTEFGRRGKALIATCDLPGKIVVNDQGGDDEANRAGKVAYLNATRREQILQKLIEKAQILPDESLPRRVVFNGKAQPVLTENPYVAALLRYRTWPTAADLETFAREEVATGGLGIIDWFAAEHPRVLWLGQQFNVRGQAMLILRRRVGEHGLVVGSTNAARYGMLAAALTTLALNGSPTATRFVILDRSIKGAQWSNVLGAVDESVLTPAGFSVQFSRNSADLEPLLGQLLDELDRRRRLGEEGVAREPSLVVTLTELDTIETMRRKADAYGGLADSAQGEKLKRLYLEGSPLGIHLLLSFSGVRPLANVIDERRGLVHFRHRVALQMSEDESHAFVRSRKASQLQIEGPSPICALYLDTESDQSIRFKPYTSDLTTQAGSESLSDQLLTLGRALAQRR